MNKIPKKVFILKIFYIYYKKYYTKRWYAIRSEKGFCCICTIHVAHILNVHFVVLVFMGTTLHIPQITQLQVYHKINFNLEKQTFFIQISVLL